MRDQSTNSSTLRAALDITAFSAVIVADAYGLVPLTLSIGLLPAVWLLLRLAREPWSTIGFRRPPDWRRAIVIGVGIGILMELFAVFVTTPWISGLFGKEPDYSELAFIQGNLTYLLIFLGLNWTLAAFGEEICFRGFLMQRVARLFGDGRVPWIISLLLVSALFGWVHSEQGV